MASSPPDVVDPQVVRELFDECVGLPHARRTLLLDERCAQKAPLRAEIERLLSLESRATAFLSAPLCKLPPFEPALRERRRAPRRLGPYRIGRLLGAGGMGMVVAAVHVQSGRQVALKHLAGSDAAHVAGLRREIRALARLRHPGIARILDQGVHRAEPWYAMEIVEGVSLHHMLRPRPGRAARERLLAVAARLCSALSYLHGEGIVHRDLKPSNVMVRRDGMPVLVDFGLTVTFGGDVARESALLQEGGVGTLAYMAPEQAAGRLVDARADLYALGAILHEVLTGEPPPASPTAATAAHSRAAAGSQASSSAGHDRAPARQLSIPPPFDALVRSLLATDPRDRPGHADVVARTLRRAGVDPTPPVPVPAARPYLYRPSLEGRDEVVARVHAALSDVAGGHGALLLLEGESGVGKTRMVLEAAAAAHRRGLVVLSGECLPHGAAGPAPLEAFARPLEAIADLGRAEPTIRAAIASIEAIASLAPFSPSLAALCGVEEPSLPARTDAEAARRRVLSGLVDLLATLARRHPVLLVLDDLQWADELTHAFLALAAGGPLCRDEPILVMGTRRTEEGPEELLRIRRMAGVEIVPLERLPSASIASMAAGMLGTPDAPASLTEGIAELSEGNPFFAAEYLRAAVAQGYLKRDARGRWQPAGPTAVPGADRGGLSGLGLPRSVRDLVSHRLAGLGAEASQVLAQAAILGRNVEPSVLAAACATGEAAHLGAVDELLARQVLVPREGDLQFLHDKVREIALEMIPRAARAALHRAAAASLETAGAPAGARLGEIASHWEQAGERARARVAYLAAAREALRRFAHGEAERLYRAYLALADEVDPDALAARAELAEEVIRALGRTEEAVVELRRALAQARALGDRARTASLLAVLGACHRDMAEGDAARACYLEALAIGRRRRDGAFQARVLRFLGVLEQDSERLGRAVARYRQALRLAVACGADSQRALALGSLGTNAFERGRYAEARRLWQESLEWHARSGDVRGEANVLGNLGLLEMYGGRFGESERLYRKSIEYLRKYGTRVYEGRVRSLLAVLLRIQGKSEAGPMFESALAIHREAQDRVAEGETLGHYAEYLGNEGQLEAAARCCLEGVATCRLVGSRRGQAALLSVYGAILEQQGKAARSRRAHEAALRTIRSHGNGAMQSDALYELARLVRRVDGDLDASQRLMKRAWKLIPAAGGIIETACWYCEQGHQNLARGRPARREVERARAIAWRLGLGPASPIGRRIARLERAIAAAEAGQPLQHGELQEDLPPRLRRRRR